MATMSHQGPRITSVKELSREVDNIRAELTATATEGDKLRATLIQLIKAVEANDDRQVFILQRQEQAERALEQLAHASSSSSRGPHRTVGEPSAPSYQVAVRAHDSGGISLPDNLFGNSPHESAERSSLAPSRGSTVTRPAPHGTQNKGKGKKPDHDENVLLLPEVIQQILMDFIRHDTKGTLRRCNYAVKNGTNSYKCTNDSFSIDCFRSDHFEYCWAHKRVITGNNLACPHPRKEECTRVYWEAHEDWESIVFVALREKKMGCPEIPNKMLKEALLPPQQYPYAYDLEN